MLRCDICGLLERVRADQCSRCGAWDSLVSIEPRTPRKEGKKTDAPPKPSYGAPKLASEITPSEPRRISTGLSQWDTALSGGVVCPSSILLAGDPGAGKTTSMVRIASEVADRLHGEALYLSSEMQEDRLAGYARRAGAKLDKLRLWYLTRVDVAVEEIAKLKPKVIVWDSIQMFAGARGATNDHQIRDTVREATNIGHKVKAISFLISQVNKDNYIAGPRNIDHVADVIAYLEPTRLLIEKNRFGIAPKYAQREVPGVTAS